MVYLYFTKCIVSIKNARSENSREQCYSNVENDSNSVLCGLRETYFVSFLKNNPVLCEMTQLLVLEMNYRLFEFKVKAT